MFQNAYHYIRCYNDELVDVHEVIQCQGEIEEDQETASGEFS